MFRRDTAKPEPNGAISHYTQWMGGPTLAAVIDCPWDIEGEPKVTANVTGEADTFFSIPAVIQVMGCRVRGWIGRDENGPVFHHTYY